MHATELLWVVMTALSRTINIYQCAETMLKKDMPVQRIMKLSRKDCRFSTVNLVKLSRNCALRQFNLHRRNH